MKEKKQLETEMMDKFDNLKKESARQLDEYKNKVH